MPLIIDGYNLMHAAGIVPRGVGPGTLERSRNALLNFLAATLDPSELPGTIVVFDAAQAPPGLPDIHTHRGMTIRFARGYTDADEMIEELVQADTSPKRLTVVSSDHRVQRAARRRRAQRVDSDVWFAEVIKRRREQRPASPGSQKPPEPSGTAELDEWLRYFELADTKEHGDEIFPPGYAEEL